MDQPAMNPQDKKTAAKGDLTTQLSRDLSLFHVTLIGVGAMIGAGIFVLTGIAAGHAGPALILAFALNGLVTLLTALSYAELGSTFPEAGGGYLWVKEGMGGLHGFQAGWMSWFAHAVACSLYILGFGYYFWEALRFVHADRLLHALLSPLFPGGDPAFMTIQKILAVTVALIFGYVNFKGASETGKWGSFITILKVMILAGFVLAGFLVMTKNPGLSHKFEPFMVKGFPGILAAMGLTYIAFEGYEIIVQSGEEIKNPARNIPRAIFISLLIVVPVYLLVGAVALGAVEIPESVRLAHPEILRVWDYLAFAKEGAMVEAARQFMPLGHFMMILAGLFATMSALNATIYSSSRVSFAMGRDKNLPDLFGRIHPRRRTPHMAILFSVVMVILMAVSLPIEDVAAAADIMFILLFLQVNWTLIKLRKKRWKTHRPFRVPWVPLVPVLAIMLQLVLGVFLFHLSPIAWASALAWLILGAIIYFSYARNREKERAEAEIVFEEKSPVKAKCRILVPLAHPDHVRDLISIAASIARENEGELLALGVVQVPGQLPVAEGRRFSDEFKSIMAHAVRVGEEKGVVVNTLIRIGHSINQAIVNTVAERCVNMMVMGWKGFSNTRGSVFGRILDDVVMNAECDVVMIKMVHLDKMRNILLTTSGGSHAQFAATLAPAIAAAYGSRVTVAMIVPPGLEAEKMATYQNRVDESVAELKTRTTDVEGRLVQSGSISQGILKLTEQYDACILGAAREGLMQQLLFGSIPEIVAKKGRYTVIMVKKHEKILRGLLKRIFKRSRERVTRR